MLPTYAIAFLSMITAIVLTCSALHFARYKRRGVGCCSEGAETGGKQVHGCKTCKCKQQAG